MKCADFDNANIIYFHKKQGTLIRRSEVNCTEPSPSVSVSCPCLRRKYGDRRQTLACNKHPSFSSKSKEKSFVSNYFGQFIHISFLNVFSLQSMACSIKLFTAVIHYEL